MHGSDLKAWRKKNGWTQSDLMIELEISSRQTVTTWENSEKIPHMTKLAIIALDQIEACRKRSGLNSQFSLEDISQMHLETLKAAKSGATAKK